MAEKVEEARDFEGLLHDHGVRVTSQRKVILDVLSSRGGSLTAEGIYQEARQLDRHINLATIYRTLATLRDSGIVQQFYISPDHSESRFALVDEPEPSPAVTAPERMHFHCRGCGKTMVLENPALSALIQQTLDVQVGGAMFKRICMCVEGFCSECAEAAR